ncbi:DUF1573 domain-containing protein [Bacteroides timonensis]|uniref:DUF1573 domain-containing protein n=1 Tax=Bacteroides timonensis TaxID=1470345 RepID=UPI0004AEB13C|nr:DUF1573 domain-containing protein [Bacteroides timonensis]
MRTFIYVIVIIFICSCEDAERKKIAQVVSYWQSREIVFPKDTSFVSYNRKYKERKVHLQKGKYTIFSYIDSTGCMSCKLQLPKWSEFIYVVDSISNGSVPFVFVFQSNKKKDLIHFLKKAGFDYPVYIDEHSSFDRLNRFPADMQLQTFLLDSNSHVAAIGNPIHNPNVKELYLSIIQGKEVVKSKKNKAIETKVKVDKASVFLGDFAWQEEQKTIFVLTNIGDNPLVIEDVNASCGCVSVVYSEEPILSGKDIKLEVTYKADDPEYFDKTITVYCNAKKSPIHLRITGNAK